MARNKESKEILGLNRITKKRIMELCKKDKLYQTPELNDVLYLHYQGFECIECLEDYTELKCLWLECNAISEIQGLVKQSKLKCLFLQSNLIRKIENLDYCKELDTINLSQNHIRKIENCGFEILPVLNTLNLSSNYLKDCEDLKELENCKYLSVLDLSNNRIDDILVVKIFGKMPELKVLVLQGNPVVSKIPQYRKTLILECKQLTYLDSRPVFPKDRACAEAWKRGGYEEERKENERWNRKERKKMRDGVNATIQLRNRNHKPEEIISLIPSSDSEDDTKNQKKNLKIRVESDVSTDSIWDEVTSSDNSCDSKTTESFQSSENCSNGDMMEDINSVEIIKDQQTSKEKMKEEKILKSEKISETVKPELGSTILTRLGEGIDFHQQYKPYSEIIEKTTDSEIFLKHSPKKVKLLIENIGGLDKCSDHTNVNSDTDPPEKYQSTIEAIKNITKSEEYPGSLLIKNTENLNKNKENVDDDNYEPLKELEETMNMLLQPESSEQLSFQLATKKDPKNPQLKLENEQERLKVNFQLKADFEELSTNLNSFVEQLDKDQEKRHAVIEALFNKNIATKESSCESSDGEVKVCLEEQKLERMIDQWDRDSTLNTKKYKDEELVKINQIIDINQDKDICEPEQCDESSKITVNKNYDDIPSFESFKYIPMDVSLLTQKSNEALYSLERESKELKRLLQQLENKNEDLFKDINPQVKCPREKQSHDNKLKGSVDLQNENIQIQALYKDINGDYNEITGEIKGEEQIKEEINEQDQKQIVDIIVKELLKSLELKPKSYKFPDLLEHPKEYDLLPTKIQPLQKTFSESIPEFTKSFNRFYKNIETKSLSPDSGDKQLQKSIALKELSKQTNIKQFNNDTLKSLDDQLKQIKKDQHKKVRRMVDRVYAQKDRYNDTLELVEDKLMVRNRDTQELRELPQLVPQDLSDSEADYDTAHSEEENDGCTKIIENMFKKDQSKTYKPTIRKSNEDLIMQALIDNKTNRAADDSEEESNDEFYSLDSPDTSNLYNIDKEFFNKLTLDNLNLSQTDENHIVQCARSYEELKHCLTLSIGERYLNEEETELLDNMIERKCVKINEKSENLLETVQISQEEQLWLNEITLKSDETKSLENVKNDFKEVKLLSSKELFEYKNESKDKSLGNTDQDEVVPRIPTIEDKSEMYSKNFRKKILLNSLAEKKEQSEEEKNDFESNIDFESCASNIKIFNSEAKQEGDLSSLREHITEEAYAAMLLPDGTAETTIKHLSNNFIVNTDSGNIEVLECNLEISDCNDEIVDTITVNAELHF